MHKIPIQFRAFSKQQFTVVTLMLRGIYILVFLSFVFVRVVAPFWAQVIKQCLFEICSPVNNPGQIGNHWNFQFLTFRIVPCIAVYIYVRLFTVLRKFADIADI